MKEKLVRLFKQKGKFALASSLATTINYFVFFFLVKQMGDVSAQAISYACGVVVNFVLQKRYIFQLNRKLSAAFWWSILISVIGLSLSTLLMWLLGFIGPLTNQRLIKKLMVTGSVFFYNFYFKRFAFERKLYILD